MMGSVPKGATAAPPTTRVHAAANSAAQATSNDRDIIGRSFLDLSVIALAGPGMRCR
jgi:hypothetical protein